MKAEKTQVYRRKSRERMEKGRRANNNLKSEKGNEKNKHLEGNFEITKEAITTHTVKERITTAARQ